MFVSKSRFEYTVANLQDECRALRQQYWEMKHAHWRLLAELGYSEKTVTEHVLLVKKDGPDLG